MKTLKYTLNKFILIKIISICANKVQNGIEMTLTDNLICLLIYSYNILLYALCVYDIENLIYVVFVPNV